MDMFSIKREATLKKQAPLAQRMRAESVEDFVGQEHIMGKGQLLNRMISADRLTSMILYGPPGTGKTTLAHIVANSTKKRFVEISAVTSGVKDIRQVVDEAKETLGQSGKETVVFIDEIHRFNKAQQDALLPHVEKGVLLLIGATTENPYFEVNKALLSRCTVFRLELLNEKALITLANMALEDKVKGLGHIKIKLEEDGLNYLVKSAQGDGRNLLNTLELAALTTMPNESGVVIIDAETIKESSQIRRVRYDKDGEQHYDIISAFIKSIRGSDPQGALHWLASMIEGGEDPKFIARRLIVSAAEDIGMADPIALSVAVSAFDAINIIGMPEGRIPLAEATIYLALAPKSNSAYLGINNALAYVRANGPGQVPEHLKNIKIETQDKDIENLGYKYPHDFPNHYVKQDYLPQGMRQVSYYSPGKIGIEAEIAKNWEKTTKIDSE
ncbi:MAG: replication-associated recombination protein A [Tissierellia bacterium]|nr:replication-associated recombination protein A [Tissierellia bacterium]